MQLNAYQNYSDNDYKVKTNDSNRGDSEEKWYRRFHDGYHNEAVIAKVGVVNKPWADRLLLGFTYSHEYAEIQNSNMMAIVFGGKHRKTEGLAPTLNYVKKNLLVKNLDLSVSARYDKTTTNNIDTVARTYYWTGEYINKETQGKATRPFPNFTGKLVPWWPISDTTLQTGIISPSITCTVTMCVKRTIWPPMPDRTRPPIIWNGITRRMCWDSHINSSPARSGT